jgi:hypothetical protein
MADFMSSHVLGSDWQEAVIKSVLTWIITLNWIVTFVSLCIMESNF